MKQSKSWNVMPSIFAKNTYNPIRSIVETLKIEPNPEKPMIALSIGDPTIFGNLKPSKEITDAVIAAINEGKYNGYAPSTGYPSAKEAVAKYCSTPQSPLEPNDVILCSGCSCALDITISALCSPGQNILIPRPGFAIYQTLANGLGVGVKYYDLMSENNWEVDLVMLEESIDDQTAAIVVNNPSNPCGCVYSKKHLLQILDVAERHKIPIIADEIYDNFVFEGQEFHWIASLTKEVPVLSCGGLTKRFLVPGWRMGWITINDRNDIFGKEVRSGLLSLSQRIIGSNTIVQGALPDILSNTPDSFFQHTLRVVQDNAKLSYSIIKNAKGLKPIMPQGAMYMMVGVNMACFPEYETDLQLVEAMISEESVFCLPGKCFNVSNFFRVVLTVPEAQMLEACHRIEQFCERHYCPLEDYNDSNEVSNGIMNGNHNGNHNGIHNGNGNDVIMHEADNDNLSLSKAALLKRDIIAFEVDGE